ncbi:MAG: tetratricopeptide repeat protein [Bacteroidota bacterium]
MKWTRTQILSLTGILVFCLIVFFPSLFNGFTNWDDPSYVTKNVFIRGFGIENWKAFFFSFHNGHYHPLTWISLAVDYAIGGNSPFVYHLGNLLLHLFNVTLVFALLMLLTENLLIAIVVSLLFAIHPDQVESVAWISERKTLLFAFFYLASLFYYIKHIKLGKNKYYYFALVLFILSVLAKTQAIVLVMLFFAVDYYFDIKPFSKKNLIRKGPYVVLALIFAVLTLFAQQASDSPATHLSLYDRFAYSSFALVSYIVKLFVPLHLSALYPYQSSPDLSGIYIFYIIASIFLLSNLIYFSIKSKKFAFGAAFFFVNIVMVLKFFDIPKGPYVMADRYMYLSSIGIFFLIALGINLIKKENLKRFSLVCVLFFVLLTSLISRERTGVWKNSINLWNNALSSYPDAIPALINRGNAYRDEKQYANALPDYNKAIQLNPLYFEAFLNRGYIYDMMGKADSAYLDYTKTILINPNSAEAYMNRANLLVKINQLDSALNDINHSISILPNNAKSLGIRSNIYFKQLKYTDALNDLNIAEKQSKDDDQLYYNRANIHAALGNFPQAIEDYNRAISINPHDENIWFNRANTRFRMQNYSEAYQDYSKVIQQRQKFTEAWAYRGNSLMMMGKYADAISDYNNAIKLSPNYGPTFLNRGIAKCESGNKAEGCDDMKKALSLGTVVAEKQLEKYCK